MTRPFPVTLQISLAPPDFRHARALLPHQVRTWRDQVDEIFLTVDFHRSPGRFGGGWEEGRDSILALARSIPGARVAVVDYEGVAAARVSAEFFGGRRIPAKDFRGGPYYAYFFGLAEARHDFVLHADSDLLFGGGSRTWLAEAVGHMLENPDVLFAAPLPGPPSAAGRLRSQAARADPRTDHAFLFDTMSTRLFLLHRERFCATIGALRPAAPPSWRNRLQALAEGHPVQDLPEHLFGAAMRAQGLVRREFLGAAPGMWSLHSPYRNGDFYARASELVRRVEAGDIPEAQRGDHDLNASMVDWTDAIAALRRDRWWRRWGRAAGG